MSDCKCGGVVEVKTHDVSGKTKKREWLQNPSRQVPEGSLSVYQRRCRSCGRQEVRIFDAEGYQVEHRG